MGAEEKEFELDIERNTKFLTFSLGEETYGINIKDVIEIINMQTFTHVPELPDYMKGIINLRGNIIPIIDIRARFKKQEIPYDERTCIIVVDIFNIPAGLIVDNVDEVIDIPEQDIVPPPSARTGFDNQYISGIGKRGSGVVLLIEGEKLFQESDLTQITDINTEIA